ncbi:ATP-dependent RecD-like DNA helicase [bioreactor metagenome]|uniref:ATP-dependent RecD-like DNA helicase n=1 Tax=bioreactor metagenome TaxID=1076179 RepID=A0A644TQK9_9ZZZZ
MLSISNVSAHQASTYYEKDGYYARLDDNNDQWQGNLQQELGLPENVNPEDFNKLINERKERAGFDLCFSAPKSVSVAMVLDESTRQAMIEAHNAAVKATLEQIEKREIGARITKDGVTEHVKTGNMIAAKFDHYVSRNSDPQLHTHGVILNKTKIGDKWYAVDNPDLYKNKILYGQLYRNALAQELMNKGYEITVTDPQKGFFELKGIEQEVINQFSSRRQEIVEKLKEWGTNTPEAASTAAIMTRQAKEHKSMDMLMDSWKETLDEMGGATIVKADAPISLTPDQQKAEFEQAIKQLSRKQFAFTEKELKRAVLAAGVGSGMSETEYEKLMKSATVEKSLIGLGGIKGSDDPTIYCTTKQNLETEKKIFHEVARGKGTIKAMETAQARETLTKALGKDPLSDQQREAILTIATTKDKYLAIQGLAGTGKTYMLNYARQVLESDGYEVKGACFTGKAAQGLQTDAKIPSSTIHGLLNRLEREAGNRKQGEDMQNKTEWNLKGLKPSATKEAWVVDEASMVDNKTMSHLMEAAKIKGAKVVLVGDRQQLLPIGVGNAFAVLTETQKINTVMMDEIRRQKNVNLLQAVREAVKGDLSKSLELIEEDTHVIAKRNERMKTIVADYTTLSPEQQQKTIVLTALNKDRCKLNRDIRADLKNQGLLGSGKTYEVEDAEGKSLKREFVQKDKVIFLENDNWLGIMNGQIGIVETIEGNVMTVQSGEKAVTIDLNQYKKIDHGYAMTTYKSQSMTVDRALINLDSKQEYLNSRNAFYVDISRARHEVKVYTDNREKVTEQIAVFAKKITSEDFLIRAATEGKVPVKRPSISDLFQRGKSLKKDDFKDIYKSLMVKTKTILNLPSGKKPTGMGGL